ncbi:MAG: FAD-dependent monooxygenase [Flavobacteriales bacterium]|nr:FAD-dependent monooxygenase [Flavobacteriales bacterium]
MELNRRLLTEAEKLPNVKLHFNHRCADVHLDNATCTFHNDITGESAPVKADIVFGSDGAFSAVRQKMMQAASPTARSTSSTITRKSPSPRTPMARRRWTRNACTSGRAGTS